MLKSLKLVNYRSFSKLYLKFHPKKNIILANNAKGKSNVIESIYMLSFLKSFRTERNAELIKFGNASAYASFEYLYKDILNRIEITIEPKGKLVKQNDKMIKNAKEYNQRFEAVLFEPFDLNILKGAPGLRRKYIDSILTRLSPSYRDELLSYNKVLMNRNKALKMYKDKNSLKAVLKSYDTQLITLGAALVEKRKTFTENFNAICKAIHMDLSGGDELLIEYKTNIDIDNDIKTAYENAFTANLDKDIERKTTALGPHRDDYPISIGGNEARKFASQGQLRTVMLAMKIAELKMISAFNKDVTLLLDDVFSELDKKRKQYLLDAVGDMQVIFTLQDMDDIKDLIDDDYLLIKLETNEMIYGGRNGR